VHHRIIARNIFSTWIGYVSTLLIGFLLSPFIVHHLGTTGYGVWTLIVSLTGYFGMLDLGLRQSVGRFVAHHVALDDSESVNRTLSTAIAMLAGGGLVVLLATGFLVANFSTAFRIEHAYETSARIALLIAGIQICIALPMSVFSTILMSLERFDIMTGVTVTGAIIRATLVVVLLKMGYGLPALATVTLVVSSCEYTAGMIWAKALYSPLRLAWRYVDLSTARELFGFGLYRFLWIISNQVIFYTDSVVIGMLLSVSAITYYAIAGSLINYARNLVAFPTDTFFPAASRLHAKNDKAGLRELQILGSQIDLLIGLPLCVGLLFFGRPFISLWMGKEYASSWYILAILTIPQFTSMSQYISGQILLGMARHKMLAYLAMAEAATNLALSIILIRQFGVIGVAWGTAIPHLISTGVILPLYTLRAIGLDSTEYFLRAYQRPVLCAVPFAFICYGVIRFAEPSSWLLLAFEVAFVCGCFGIMVYFWCLTPSRRVWIRHRAWNLFSGPAVSAGVQVGPRRD